MPAALAIIAMWIGGYGTGLSREYRTAGLWGWFIAMCICLINITTIDLADLMGLEGLSVSTFIIASILVLSVSLGLVFVGYVCGRATLWLMEWWER